MQSLLMPILLMVKIPTFLEKEFGDDVVLVQCPFRGLWIGCKKQNKNKNKKHVEFVMKLIDRGGGGKPEYLVGIWVANLVRLWFRYRMVFESSCRTPAPNSLVPSPDIMLQ